MLQMQDSDEYVTHLPVLINVLLGVSIFSIPWGYYHSGYVNGSLIVVAVAIMSFETVNMLLEIQRKIYQRTGKILDYSEISNLTLGSNCEILVKVCTIISCIGGCVGYLIFLGEVTSQIFTISRRLSTIITVALLIFLEMYDMAGNILPLITKFGMFSIVTSLISTIIDGSTRDQIYHDTPTESVVESNYLSILGPCSFLFTIHYCVMQIRTDEIVGANSHAISYNVRDHDILESNPIIDNYSGENSKIVLPDGNNAVYVKPMTKSLTLSYFISVVVILAFGMTGDQLYRNTAHVLDRNGNIRAGCEDKICQNVILNVSNYCIKWVIGSTLGVSVFASYKLLITPAKTYITDIIGVTLLKKNSKDRVNSLYIGISLVCVTGIVALVKPYFGICLGFIGGLTDAVQAFVLPPILVLKIYSGDEISSLRKLEYICICIFGLMMILSTIVTAIK